MKTISKEEATRLVKNISLLIMTATDIETDKVLEYIKPISDDYEDIIEVYIGSQTYYIGMFGSYKVAHVQTAMGSIGRDSSILTTQDAINFWNPKAIIMVGIAFGKNSSSQKIGDVLISEAIIPYETLKMGKDGEVQRSLIVPSGQILLNRFKNCRSWKFELPNGKLANKIVGKILSGEKLIDNEEFKKNLFKKQHEAIGGEMEAGGLFAASAHNYKNEWIIVKGICDWADGNKNDNKEDNQSLAAEAAVSLCYTVLSNEHTLQDLLKPEIQNKEDEDLTTNKTNLNNSYASTQIFNGNLSNVSINYGNINEKKSNYISTRDIC